MNTGRRHTGAGLAAALLGALCAAEAGAAPLERIAFGSCARQDQPQPIWEAVLAHRPDLFVLAGDNVYADTTRAEEFRAAYQALADHDGFARLREEVPIVATWDDHDFGANDAGADFPAREVSERAFLEFFDVPHDDPRRERPGIYTARRYGPPGKRVQVILLDTRYFRSAVPKAGDRYQSVRGPDVTMLGAAQWDWLERVLERPADLRLLVSSTQVLPRPAESESWGTMPEERDRLLELLREAGRTILLSGDRHFGEILRMPADAREGIGYPLYEVTASGLNVAGDHWEVRNRYRYDAGPYGDDHFGLVEIDWAAGRVRLAIVSAEGEAVRSQEVDLAALARKASEVGDRGTDQDVDAAS